MHKNDYCMVASSSLSCIEAHAGLFRLPKAPYSIFKIAYEGDFRSLFSVTFWQKVYFLISNVH